jgi:hypothetical protein
LIDASSAIVDQIDRGIMLVGAATEYSHHGDALSDGTLSVSAHINTAQLEAYNSALMGMQQYMPYGSVADVLENAAVEQLELMDNAIETFTEVTVDMITVVQVAEISEQAVTPDDKAEVQMFVSDNAETLQISQEDVETYNQSLDDIETHANTASAYIAVAANAEAVEFLQTGAENNNADAAEATLSYDANMQWVRMGWANTSNGTAVMLNGGNFGMPNLYASEPDILVAGTESEFYQTSPVALGYECFMNQTDCEI